EDEAAERGAAVVLAFASKPTAPIFLGPLGWTEVARLRVWARPLPTVGTGATPVVQAIQLDGDAASSWPNHVIRDGPFVRWRYLDSPKGYKAVRRDDGYAVVGRKRRGERTVATIADLAGDGVLAAAMGQADGCRLLLALPAPAQRRSF